MGMISLPNEILENVVSHLLPNIRDLFQNSSLVNEDVDLLLKHIDVRKNGGKAVDLKSITQLLATSNTIPPI